MAGLKGYVTNLEGVTAEFVIDAYHRLFQIEVFPHVQARPCAPEPIYHHKRE